MLRRTCDFRFVPLAEMVKLYEGGFPFRHEEMSDPDPSPSPGPFVPPPVGASPAVAEAVAQLADANRERKPEERISVDTVSVVCPDGTRQVHYFWPSVATKAVSLFQVQNAL